MDYEKFLDPEEVEINGVKFTLSRIPAVQAQQVYGELVKASDGVGDIGMTFLPQNVSRTILSYAAFYDVDSWAVLDTEIVVNNAFRSLDTLLKLEVAMIRKNFGFLFDGGLRGLLEALRGIAPATSKSE